MLEPMNIVRVTEKDVTALMQRIGGIHLEPDEGGTSPSRADYLFDDCIIELKFLEEDALDGTAAKKQERLDKIADLYADDPSPVVVVGRSTVPTAHLNEFDSILATPIRKAITKGSSQLKKTTEEYPNRKRVLMLVNTGYTTLNHEEFEELALWRLQNDTSNVDVAIIAGVYIYSDGMDTYGLSMIEEHVLQGASGIEKFKALQADWGGVLGQTLIASMRGEWDRKKPKYPVQDVVFKSGGKTFVVPAPKLGPSKIYINGRPRRCSTPANRSGVTVIPRISEDTWSSLRDRFGNHYRLHGSYQQWQKKWEQEINARPAEEPIFGVDIQFEELITYSRENRRKLTMDDVFSFAVVAYNKRVQEILNKHQAFDRAEKGEFIHVHTRLIGQDEANDVSIVLAHRIGREPEVLWDNVRGPLSNLVGKAAGYGVDLGIANLRLSKDTTYAWE